MDASTFRDLQAKIKMTNVALANKLGVTPVTISNWRRGAHAIPGAVAFVMRTLADRAVDAD